MPLRQICEPVLAEMVRDTGLTCRAAVVTDGFPVFVARVDAHGAIRFNAPLGVREMPHTSSAGKAILANLRMSVVSQVIAGERAAVQHRQDDHQPCTTSRSTSR